MRILRWNNPIRTPLRYASSTSIEDKDEYELHIIPLVEPDGKIHFEEHTLIRNGEVLRRDIYQYNPNVPDAEYIRLGKNRVIDLN